MIYEIYSMGDANYLAMVLNAVAAIGNAGGYRSIAALGLITGLLFISIKAVLDGGNFKLQHFLVAFVCYQVMFGVRSTVMVNDVYNGNSRTVANVPWGLAFIGSMMSNIGYKSTQMMEQAFSLPNMTVDGFGGSLALLLNTRRINEFGVLADHGCTSTPTTRIPSGSSEWKCSVSESMKAYLRDCFAPAVDIKIASYDDFNNAPSAWTAASAAAVPGFATSIFIGRSAPVPDGGWPMACDEAYQTISSRLNDASFFTQFNNFAKSRIGAKVDARAELDAALSGLGQAGVSAQEMMINAAITQTAQIAKTEYVSQIDRDQAAIMLAQGLAQRNTQWAGEATFFAHYVRPMVTFFEALGFSLAPFIVFLLMLGPIGMSLAWKYFHLPLWVALWMPVMAIINAYINFVAQGKLAAIAANEVTSPSSITGLIVNSASIQDWLGTGSMLASSVPAITAALLYGGGAALSGLASRMQSGDFVQEKLPSPDVVSPSAAIGTTPSYRASREVGTFSYNAASSLPGAQINESATQLLSSVSGIAQNATRATGAAISNAFSSNDQSRQGFAERASLARAVEGSSNRELAAQYKAAYDIADKYNIKDASAQELIGSLIAQGGISAGNQGAIMGRLGLTGSLTDSQKTSLSKELNQAFGISTEAAGTEATKASLSNKVAQGLNKEAVSDLSRTLGAQRASQIEQRFTEQTSATESYNALSSLQRSSAAQIAVDPLVFASRLGGAAASAVTAAALKTGGGPNAAGIGDTALVRQRHNEEMEKLRLEGFGGVAPDGNVAENVAMYRALSGLAAEGRADSAMYAQAAAKLYTIGAGGNFIDTSSRNAGMRDVGNGIVSQVKQETDRPILPVPSAVGAVSGQVEGALREGQQLRGSVEAANASTATTAQGEFDSGTRAVEAQQAKEQGAIRSAGVSAIESDLRTESVAQTSPSGSWINRIASDTMSYAGRAWDAIRTAAGDGDQVAAEQIEKYNAVKGEYEQRNLPPEIAALGATMQNSNLLESAMVNVNNDVANIGRVLSGEPTVPTMPYLGVSADEAKAVIADSHLRRVQGVEPEKATPRQIERAQEVAEAGYGLLVQAQKDPDGKSQSVAAQLGALFNQAEGTSGLLSSWGTLPQRETEEPEPSSR